MTPTRRVIRAKMAEVTRSLPPAHRVLEIGIAGDDPPGANREFVRLAEGGIYQTADKDAALKPDLVLDLTLTWSPVLCVQPFDLVICSQVLEHIWELEAAVISLWRLTALGGCCLVDMPFCYPPHGQPGSDPDYWRLTPAGLKRLLHRAGFGQVEVWVDPAWLAVGAIARKQLTSEEVLSA